MFWKKVAKSKDGKVENCNRIKDWNGRIMGKTLEGSIMCIQSLCCISLVPERVIILREPVSGTESEKIEA